MEFNTLIPEFALDNWGSAALWSIKSIWGEHSSSTKPCLFIHPGVDLVELAGFLTLGENTMRRFVSIQKDPNIDQDGFPHFDATL